MTRDRRIAVIAGVLFAAVAAIAVIVVVAFGGGGKHATDDDETLVELADPRLALEPKVAYPQQPHVPADDDVARKLKVRVTNDAILIVATGVPDFDPVEIPRAGRASDVVLGELDEHLQHYHDNELAGRSDLELSSDKDVQYKDLIDVMDHAIKDGFTDVSLVDR